MEDRGEIQNNDNCAWVSAKNDYELRSFLHEFHDSVKNRNKLTK